jgi:hypothetical protein
MMRRAWVAALPLVLAGCAGGGDSGAQDKEASASASAASASAAAEASASAAAAAEAEQRAKQQARHDACASGTSGLMSALQEIDSRLDVGLNYSEYGDRVGDAKVAYDAMLKPNTLQRNCLIKVAVVLETALNEYLDVYNIWGDCINDYSCDFNTGETNKKAQTSWANASRDLAKAQRGLDSLAPAP